MFNLFLFIFLCLLHNIDGTYINDDDNIVQLPKGKIQGHVLRSYKGNDYYAFQEIPYAAPPIGKNRFQLPQEPEAWSGILNTTQNKKMCYQPPGDLADLELSEDCLYLNVYTPVKPGSEKLLPVLLWIHGGSLQTGCGAYQFFGPKYLIDSEIVVVTFNYRVGPLGFLGTTDGVIPLNLGFKDQRFAIEWVNENIHLFGGDPNHIILDGESAGGRSVSFHLLGPWTTNKQSFHGAIMQSGTSISGTVIQLNPNEIAFKLGKALDHSFSSNNTKELLKVLQKYAASDILKASSESGVSVEVDGPFSYAPYEAFLNGNFKNVPTLTGFNSEELALQAFITNEDVLKTYDENPNLLINNLMNMSPENKTIAGNLLRQIYTDNTTFIENEAGYIRYKSDEAYTTPICKQAELASLHNSHYLYQFAYKGEIAGGMAILPILPPGLETVFHSEDLSYIWDNGRNSDLNKFCEEDQLALHRNVKMWTNFVKYLNPTPAEDPLLGNVTWLPTEPNTLRYLNINGTLEMRNYPRQYQQVKEVLEFYQEPPFIAFD